MASSYQEKNLWVILPAYNESLRLPATLNALEQQLDKEFSLIIVDNASTDSTGLVAKEFAKGAPFPTKVLFESVKGVGSAVDSAARYAISQGAVWLARTDADSLPARDWVREIKTALNSGSELAIGAMSARKDESAIWERLAFKVAVSLAIIFGRIRPMHRGGISPYMMHGGFNMAITADLYQRCGGMPRQPSPTDRLFMNRARAAGGKIRRHRKMRVETSMRRFKKLGFIGTARWYLGQGAVMEDPR